MTKGTVKIGKNQFITGMQAKLQEVSKDPEKLVILAKLLKSDFCIPPGYKTQTLTYSKSNTLFNLNQLIDNEELSINITNVGDVYAGSGLKITLIGL